MNRTARHLLLSGSLLGLLVGCGQVPGQSSSISGTVRAPVGGDVAGTRVFACYQNERGCDFLGEVTLTEPNVSANYQLGQLAPGSYSVYALKDTNEDGVMSGSGDFYGYYNSAGRDPLLVTPPAANVDIQMVVLPDSGSVPQVIQELNLTNP